VAALRRRLDGQVFDLVFINAGIVGPLHQDAAQASREEVAALFLTNAVAPVAAARALVDLVRDGSGIVGFMTSDLGVVAGNTDGYIELYRASKAALNSLIRSFAAGTRGRRITVLAMHPGWVRTDMGGPDATLSVEGSVRGIADVIAARRGSGGDAFVDYRGVELAW
jgi:NAD(P)-dependent dehydrogenase (short-subunit alcohol dehydrogenase family)